MTCMLHQCSELSLSQTTKNDQDFLEQTDSLPNPVIMVISSSLRRKISLLVFVNWNRAEQKHSLRRLGSRSREEHNNVPASSVHSRASKSGV